MFSPSVIDTHTGELIELHRVTTLNYDPKYIGALIIAHSHQERSHEEITELGEPGDALHGFLVIKQSCGGGRRVVPVLCSDPLCIPCQKLKAWQDRRRWEPVVKKMRHPHLITFTIPDGVNLAERIDFFQASFRRLLSMRLGSRNLKNLQTEAMEFARRHYAELVTKGEMTEVESLTKLTQWETSIQKFVDQVKKRHDKKGKWPEMRAVIGPGFARLEITFEGDWHVHRHLCVDGDFIPWPFLCAAWLKATGGAARVVDVRPVDKTPDGMAEAVKYITKPWDIPEAQQDDFRAALRGMKRIWPLGKAKPEEVESLCPYCGDPNCKAHPDGRANLVESGNLWGRDYKVFETDPAGDGTKTRFVMLRGDDGQWREAPLLDTLRVCAAVGKPSDAGYADLMAIKAKRRERLAKA